MAVRLDTPIPVERAIAAYEVTIGKGGPLPRPITLTFTHDAIPETERLVAARWDTDKAAWVPLRLTRRSTTVSVVETDHLCIVQGALRSARQRLVVGGEPVGRRRGAAVRRWGDTSAAAARTDASSFTC